ncbi:MAG TPA: hypothetical protein VKF82_01685 [Candidatus Eremiobacteraceae bacterium]|nr:hypothetical protein [Candidatus Eremiobacteraceae bacterium]
MDNFKFMNSWSAWVRWVAVVPVATFFYGLAALLTNGLLRIWDPRSFRLAGVFLVATLVICSSLFVWCGAATAPRFKLVIALLLGLGPLIVAFYAAPVMGWFGYAVFGGGVFVAWALATWGYLRRRRAGSLSRATDA